MKRIAAIFSLALLLVVSISSTAQAHILKQNNGIYAIMHIDPDDNPSTGEVTTILVEFGANQGSFHLSDCDCQATFLENGQQIARMDLEPAFLGANFQSLAKVTFPKIDVYELQVTGKSKGSQFKTFKLDFIIRVATASTNPDTAARNDGIAIVVISLLSLGALGALAYLQISRGGRYKTKETR